MQALLERISTKPAELPATYEPTEPSGALMGLWDQVETQEWREPMLEQFEGEILVLYNQLLEYYHDINCEECLFGLQLSVERYLGTRGPWCLNYQMEEYRYQFEEMGDPDPYPGCPKAEDYEIGCYGHSSKDTIRFIKDRLAWAIEFTDKRFKAAFKLIPILENWIPSRGIPEVAWLSGMIDELADNPTIFLG